MNRIRTRSPHRRCDYNTCEENSGVFTLGEDSVERDAPCVHRLGKRRTSRRFRPAGYDQSVDWLHSIRDALLAERSLGKVVSDTLLIHFGSILGHLGFPLNGGDLNFHSDNCPELLFSVLWVEIVDSPLGITTALELPGDGANLVLHPFEFLVERQSAANFRDHVVPRWYHAGILETARVVRR